MTQSTETVSLLPCPFCGGQAELREGEECAYVQCLVTKMHRGPFIDGDNNAADEAIAAWNTRISTNKDETIAKLREALGVSSQAVQAFLDMVNVMDRVGAVPIPAILETAQHNCPIILEQIAAALTSTKKEG